jgi:hypothetical protein
MGKKIGSLLLGVALIGASFIPGLPVIAGISIKALFLTSGIGLGLGALRGASQRQGFALQPVIDTQAPLPVVYGRTKLAMRYADRRTYGENNEHLWIVGALCHGSEDGTGIEAIDEIYFDDRLAIAADGTIQAPFTERLTFTKYLGTDAQTVDPTLNATDATAWPSTSKGKGIAYVVLHLMYDPEVYPTGEPVITAIVRGQKVNDIRNGQTISAMTNATPVAVTTASPHAYATGDRVTLYLATPTTPQGFSNPQLGLYTITVTGASTYTLDGTTAPGGAYTASSTKCVEALYSTNPACCITDYLTSQRYGGKFDMAEIDQPSFTAMANYYDSIVTKNDTLATTGKLFECNGWLDVSQTVKDNLAQLASSARALVIPEGGQFRLVTRRVVSPTAFTLSEANIIGDWSYDMPGIGVAPNSIQGVYVEPGTAEEKYPFQPVTRIWPRPGASNGYLTADNDYEVIHETSLPFTTDPYTAEQIILVLLKEARSGETVQVTCTEAALQLQVGDLVPLTHPTPGWVAQNFWVMATLLDPDTLQVRLSLLKYDADAYDLDALDTVPSPPTTSLPNPFAVLSPTDLELTAGTPEARPDRDGSWKVYIRATWTATTHPYLHFYEVQYRRSGTGVYLPAPDTNRTDTEAEIPASEGTSWDVRVRAVNTLGVASDWIEESITPLLDVAWNGSFMLDDFSSRTPGRRWVQKGGVGTFVDVHDPDAGSGGSVARATGPVWYEYADSIPFDPKQLYTVMFRCRQLRDPGAGSKEFSIGVAGVAQTPGQPDVFTYVNVAGQNEFDNQHFVCVNRGNVETSRDFVDYYGFIQGYAGGKFTLTSDMLSHSGLGSFSPTACVDGDTNPTQVAFTTASAVAGAYLLFDLGEAKSITECRFHMSDEGSTAEWALQFADTADGPWTTL